MKRIKTSNDDIAKLKSLACILTGSNYLPNKDYTDDVIQYTALINKTHGAMGSTDIDDPEKRQALRQEIMTFYNAIMKKLAVTYWKYKREALNYQKRIRAILKPFDGNLPKELSNVALCDLDTCVNIFEEHAYLRNSLKFCEVFKLSLELKKLADTFQLVPIDELNRDKEKPVDAAKNNTIIDLFTKEQPL